ncbi:glycosyltransferase family 4 protein [Lonepinella sp. BR2271]|uniref:glycosyltransferase family 4 protein n=1 Tax=Lonepinella sp. BR2271 TaxID=3434550 RepID=UPI003F6DE246
MNVLFVINSLRHKSGIERVASLLANLFHGKLNYSITIVNRDTEIDNIAYPLNQEISVVSLNGNYLQFHRKLQRHIDEFHYDVIVVHNMGRLSLLCSFLKKKQSKLISLEHVAFEIRPWWVKYFSKLCYKNINQVITLTQHDQASYQSWVKQVQTIYNISPFSIISEQKEKPKKFVAVGRLTYQKNFQALLLAWHQIQKEIPDWSLEIYGVGEEEQSLRNLIKEKKIDNVALMGQAQDIESVYQNSSIFVMSSRFEGLPMVLIEAQSFGLPIISFDCPHGPKEIIEHNVNGLLVDNQDIEKLAYSMKKLAINPTQIDEFSMRALKSAERFQKDEILKSWHNLLEV